MHNASPIHIWRKSVTRDYLAANEARLRALSPEFAVIEKPARKRLLIEAVCANQKIAAQLLAAFGGRTEKLPRDWLARFLKSQRAEPIRIGRQLLISNAPLRSASERVLLIPAGAAFGTGEHATTAMSLRMLQRVSRKFSKPWRMLDAGTGSGILALAGACFGADKVVAVDNDSLAISTAQENARANGIRGVRFIVGDVKNTRGESFNLITANLYAELLASLLPRFRKILATDGTLILSGVLRAQERDLQRALQTNGFRIDETRRRGKWIALRAVRFPFAKQKRG